MRHDWREYKPPHAHPLADPSRKCENCGAVQTLCKSYSWGRVVDRRWLPLAGRCKLPPSPVEAYKLARKR